MGTEAGWIGVDQFATAAGVSRQAAWKAIRSASQGRLWRGRLLEVRAVFGRGGNRGIRYEVALNSLSEALEGPEGLDEQRSIAAAGRPTVGTHQGALVGVRFAAIEVPLHHPRGTHERAESIRAEAAKGKHTQRTLHRWLTQYEAHGMAGLARRRPSDAGKKRVEVSWPFDKAFRAGGYGDELLARIGAEVDQRLKDIWASRAEAAGWADVCRRAEFELWKACQAHGVAVPEAAMRLSRRHVERFAEFRQVNLWRNNRKAFADGQPRIARDWTALDPMQRIVADVKHLDVILQRPDGSEVWPKVVGFHDAGTGRVFLYPLLLARGEGVRQEHVIEAFIAMVDDRLWGMPKSLYLDNGSEFACFEKLRPALELLGGNAGQEIIYAKPYNASAKTVENSFKRLDTYLFSSMPGYAGGDRMWKKTQTLGRPPTPYPGTWDEFCLTLTGLLIDFNARPYRRQDGSASALERFKAKVAAGWRPTLFDRRALDAACCDRESRRIDRGVLHIGGRDYRCEELDGLAHRREVVVALPWRRGGDPMVQLPDGTWVGASEDLAYSADEKDGAREAGRRQHRHQKGVRALAAEALPYDPVQATIERSRRHLAAAIEGRHDRMGASAELLALVDGREAADQAKTGRAAAALTAEEVARRREEAETRRLERKFNYG